jgi:hypothetical protein
MNKLAAVIAVLALLASCSVHKVTDPVVQKPNASGTPLEDDGGGGDPSGGNPYYMNVAERIGWTWLDNKILDYLYPDDAVYEFKS